MSDTPRLVTPSPFPIALPFSRAQAHFLLHHHGTQDSRIAVLLLQRWNMTRNQHQVQTAQAAEQVQIAQPSTPQQQQQLQVPTAQARACALRPNIPCPREMVKNAVGCSD